MVQNPKSRPASAKLKAAAAAKASAQQSGNGDVMDGLTTIMSSSETFASALGNITWLMTMSAGHKEKPVIWLEKMVFPALLMKQFKLYFKGKQPVALIVFGLLSDEARKVWDDEEKLPAISDWRSGNNITVFDCISPFADRQKVIDEFVKSVPQDKLNV